MNDFMVTHVHRKSGSIKEMVGDRQLDMLSLHTTIRKYHNDNRFVPFPVTFDNHEGHSPVVGLLKCNSINIYATFRTVSAYMVRRAVPRR